MTDRTPDNVRDSLNLAVTCVEQALSAMIKSGDVTWSESARELYQIDKTLTAIRSLAAVKAAARRKAAA